MAIYLKGMPLVPGQGSTLGKVMDLLLPIYMDKDLTSLAK